MYTHKYIFLAVLLFALVLPLVGCGSVPVHLPARTQVKQDLPPVGQVSTVELGEKMMIQNDYQVALGVMLPVTRVTGSLGEPWDMAGFYEESTDHHYCGISTSRLIGSDGRKFRICYTEDQFRGHIPNFTKTELIVPQPQTIRRVLEYTGRVDNRLTFSYREFTETKDGVFIRPAYTQDFNFDLAQGNSIGVKGARIKVVEATNTGITYEVVAHFPR